MFLVNGRGALTRHYANSNQNEFNFSTNKSFNKMCSMRTTTQQYFTVLLINHYLDNLFSKHLKVMLYAKVKSTTSGVTS